MSGARIEEPGRLVLALEGFEGPLDLLLDLARQQKLDIARINVLALVDQYLAVIEGARSVRLELAADWLVMAAWLAWLKSRLLLPVEERPAEEEDPEIVAGRLAERLLELDAMRRGSAWLGRRPQLGQEVFGRGAAESLTIEDRSRIAADLPGLVRAYLAAEGRAAAKRPWRPKPRRIWTVADAVAMLSRMLRSSTGWDTLAAFLPPGLSDPVESRAALAATLVAGLEMARGGAVELRQDEPFAPILLRPAGRLA